MRRVVDGDEFYQQVLDEFERDLVGSVGNGIGGIRVHLHEKPVDAGGHGRAGQHRRKLTIAAGRAAESAGPLHGMRRIEDHWQTFLAHPVERAHVGHEVVVAEGRAALGDEEMAAAKGAHFVGDVHRVPWRKELAFLHIDRAAGFRSGFKQVGLTAQKRGDLQQIDEFRGDIGLFGGVNVGRDRHAELLANFSKNPAALARSGSAKRTHRCAVGFVEGCFENEMDAGAIGDVLERARHVPGEGLRLERAGTEDEKGHGSADWNMADVEWFECHDA